MRFKVKLGTGAAITVVINATKNVDADAGSIRYVAIPYGISNRTPMVFKASVCSPLAASLSGFSFMNSRK